MVLLAKFRYIKKDEFTQKGNPRTTSKKLFFAERAKAKVLKGWITTDGKIYYRGESMDGKLDRYLARHADARDHHIFFSEEYILHPMNGSL